MESFISDLVETGPEFEPKAYTCTITAATADSAMVSFVDDHGRTATGVLPVSGYLPGTTWGVGDRLVALQVSEAPKAVFTQSSPVLVEHLFAGVCPEMRSGQVRIMAIVRRAGVRTKVAVAATQPGVDAVAAFVGRTHNRVDAVKRALGGEQVDVVAWHEDPRVFLANALQPAEVSLVEIDDSKTSAVAYAPKHQMAAAVGNGGLNSALAGELVGLNVKIAAS